MSGLAAPVLALGPVPDWAVPTAALFVFLVLVVGYAIYASGQTSGRKRARSEAERERREREPVEG